MRTYPIAAGGRSYTSTTVTGAWFSSPWAHTQDGRTGAHHRRSARARWRRRRRLG